MPDTAQPLRVVHLSTFDLVGGAARATWRLHHALRAAGADSTLLAKATSSRAEHVTHYRASPGLADRWKRLVARRRAARLEAEIARRRIAGVDQFSTDRGPFGAELAQRLPACDIIHLHWTSGFVDLAEFLPVALQRAAVVLTLHDVHGLTGGCHYTQGCTRWQTGCGACPQLGGDPTENITAPSWQRKQSAYRAAGRLAVIATSRWSDALAAASPLLGHLPRRLIPIGIEPTAFAPREKKTAREIVGLPLDAEIVLFVADATENPRKGFDVLAHAISRLRDRPRLLFVSLGRGQPSLPPGVRHHSLGALHDDRLLALAYSAADIFVIPSREEAFGQTTLEAFACGVPAVGSDTGGITDLVIPNETGQLAAVGDGAAFAQAITALLDDPAARAAAGIRARELAQGKFSLPQVARQHLEFYDTLIA